MGRTPLEAAVAAVQLVAAAWADLAGTSGRSYPLRPMTTVLNKFKAELAAAIERGVP